MPTRMIKYPSKKVLGELLTYFPETGILIWKRRQHSGVFNKRFAGKEAGAIENYGYSRVRINGRAYSTHRICAVLMGWDIEGKEIDHINHDRADNRSINLRIVERHQNTRNLKMNKRNKTGIAGVMFISETNRWRAHICVNNKRKNLGHFKNKEDAIACRYKAEKQYGFHEMHGAKQECL